MTKNTVIHDEDCFQKDRIKNIEKTQEDIEENVKNVQSDIKHVIQTQTENTIAINRLTITLTEQEKSTQQREKDRIRREKQRIKNENKRIERIEQEKDRRLKKRMQYIGLIGGLITAIVLIFIELLARKII